MFNWLDHAQMSVYKFSLLSSTHFLNYTRWENFHYISRQNWWSVVVVVVGFFIPPCLVSYRYLLEPKYVADDVVILWQKSTIRHVIFTPVSMIYSAGIILELPCGKAISMWKKITPTHLGLEEHEMPSYSIAEPTRKCPHHEFQLRKCFSIHTRVVFRTVESSGNITTTGLVKQRKSTEKHRNLTKQRRMGYELNC